MIRRSAIIGLAGFAQVGKSSIASLLVEEGYQELAFADGVRAFMDELDPELWPRDVMTSCLRWSEALDRHGYEWAKSETDAREWLVRIGAGARRVIGEDVWIKRVANIILADPHGLFVVSDVRYPNEAKMIQAHGGQVWRIHRPGVEADNEEERISLAAIRPDREILNDGELDELEEWIR